MSSVLEAVRVTVALADPEAPSAYETWNEEARARRKEDLDRHRNELALNAKLRAVAPLDEFDHGEEPDDGDDSALGDAVAGCGTTRDGELN